MSHPMPGPPEDCYCFTGNATCEECETNSYPYPWGLCPGCHLHNGYRGSRETRLTDAEAAAIPPLERVHVYCHVYRARGGRFDPSNWYDTAKPCADALVDTNVLADDDHEHLTGPDMRAGAVDPVPHIILTIKEIQ